MVKKMLKFFAYILFFLSMLLFFMPKVNLYYLLEKKLQSYAVVIASEELRDSGFVFKIENAHLYVKSIESATIEHIDLKIFALYNRVDIDGIRLAPAASSFFPLDIEHIVVNYNIFNPLYATLHGEGAFGEAMLQVDLLHRRVHMHFLASKVMQREYRNTLRNFKRVKNGEYIYDKNF